jgi:hypothetical protein
MLDRAQVPISSSEVQSLFGSLQHIDLASGKCPVRKDGQCAMLLDGTTYIVQMENAAPIRLTDTSGLKDVKSENDPLLRWVKSILTRVSHTTTE